MNLVTRLEFERANSDFVVKHVSHYFQGDWRSNSLSLTQQSSTLAIALRGLYAPSLECLYGFSFSVIGISTSDPAPLQKKQTKKKQNYKTFIIICIIIKMIWQYRFPFHSCYQFPSAIAFSKFSWRHPASAANWWQSLLVK